MKRLRNLALGGVAVAALFAAQVSPAWAVNNPVALEAGTTAGHVTVINNCAAAAVAVAAILTSTSISVADTPTDSGGNTWTLLNHSAFTNGSALWTYYSILTSPLTTAAASWVQGTKDSGAAAHNSFACLTDARGLGTVTAASKTSTTTSTPTTDPIANTAQPEWELVAEQVAASANTATLTGVTSVPSSNSAAGFGIKWHYVRLVTTGSNTYSNASSLATWITSWSGFAETAGGGGGGGGTGCTTYKSMTGVGC